MSLGLWEPKNAVPELAAIYPGTDHNSRVMTIELTPDQALVLFEWLARNDERNSFPVEDHAEEIVFWLLHAQLEKVLREPIDPAYVRLLEDARARVRAMSPKT